MNKWNEAEIAYGYLLQQSRVDHAEFDALLVQADSLSLSYQKGSLDTFKKSRSQSIGVRVIRDGKIGFSYTEDITGDSLKKCYFDALEAMEMSEPVTYAELVSPYDVPELAEIYNPTLSTIDLERKMKLAHDLENIALKTDSRITAAPYNGYTESDARVAYFNSKEFYSWYETNDCNLYLYALAKDASDAQMGKSNRTSRSFDSLHAESVAQEAAFKALERLGATVPKSGKSTVLLQNDQAQTFFGLFAGMLSGQRVVDKTSPAAKKKGQHITPRNWKLTDDPFYHGAYNGRPFDGEGRRSQVTPLIANGEIQNFLTDQRSAHLLGLPLTSSSGRSPYSSFDVSTSNIVVEAKEPMKWDELIKQRPETVVITNLKGMSGYNAVSGDFSIESEGDLYRLGERVGSLKNFLITGNLLDCVKGIEAFGDDVLMDSSSVITPSVLLTELSIAGK